MGLHNFIQALSLLVGWSALCYAFAIQILTAEKLLATCLCNLMCRAASAYRFCVCHGIISTPSWKQVTACSQCCMCLWMLDVRHGVASAGFKLWYYQLSQAKHFWICLALSNWDHSSICCWGVCSWSGSASLQPKPTTLGNQAAGGDIFAQGIKKKKKKDLLGLFINSGIY